MKVFERKFIKVYLFYILIISLLCFLIYDSTTIKNQALDRYRINKKIEQLAITNKNLDLLLPKRANYVNYDTIRDTIHEFRNTLLEIKNDPAYKLASSDVSISLKFLEIEKNFQIKRDIIEKYKSNNAIINNSSRYLISITQEIDNKIINKQINNILNYMVKFMLGESISQAQLIQTIENIQKNRNIPKEEFSLYKNMLIIHINTLYDRLDQQTRLFALLQDLKIDKQIDEFSKLIYTTHQNLTAKTIYNIYILMGFLVSLLVVVGYIFYKKEKSELQLKYFKEGVENSDNSIVLTDAKQKIIFVNEAFEKSTGFYRGEVLGKTPKVLKSGKQSEKFYQELRQTIYQGKKWFGEFQNVRKDGTDLYEKASITPIFGDNKKIQYFMAIKLDITKDKEYQRSIEEKNREIEKRYYHDDLTSLPNRNKLLHDMQNFDHMTLVIVNIDSFKEINDFYGIKVGDTILIKMRDILNQSCNMHSFQTYRLHADEFALLSNKTFSKNDIEEMIKCLQNKITNYKFPTINNQSIILTVSIGISQNSDKSILSEANLALQIAKKSKSTYSIFDQSMSLTKQYEENITWHKSLKHAIDTDRIIPFFQPIVDSKTMKIHSYETLIRLIETDGSIITPFKFLDVAKRSKLYHELTKIMINKAFDTFEETNIRFAINFSYEDMTNESVVRALVERLWRCKNPHLFTAEILESESIDNYEIIKDFIDTIKAFGCRVAIDDFGSGYSNFERLFQLNIDYIKIDGSIIKNIDKDRQLKIIAETITQFAKKSNIKVVAEFVHSKEVVKILNDLKIDYMQGFYFSPPIRKVLSNSNLIKYRKINV